MLLRGRTERYCDGNSSVLNVMWFPLKHTFTWMVTLVSKMSDKYFMIHHIQRHLVIHTPVLPTATNKSPKHVERCVKVSYSCHVTRALYKPREPLILYHLFHLKKMSTKIWEIPVIIWTNQRNIFSLLEFSCFHFLLFVTSFNVVSVE
jgi:hypothetical protein